MFIRWLNAISDFIHKGYNTFVYGVSTSDTVGPTIVQTLVGA